MTTTNTPFEDGLDEAFKAYIYTDYYWDGEDENKTTVIDEAELKAALLKLHKAAIVAELEDLVPTLSVETECAVCMENEDIISNRIEQYKKEGK